MVLGWKGLYNEEETWKLECWNVEMKAIKDQISMAELQHNVNLILDINKKKKKTWHKSFPICFDCGELYVKEDGELWTRVESFECWWRFHCHALVIDAFCWRSLMISAFHCHALGGDQWRFTILFLFPCDRCISLPWPCDLCISLSCPCDLRACWVDILQPTVLGKNPIAK